MDIERVFSFIRQSFKNFTARFKRYGDLLDIEFPYQIGFDKVELNLGISVKPMDYKKCVIKQGNLIKTLYKENKAMKKSLEESKVVFNAKKLDNDVKIQLENELYRSIRNALIKEFSQQKLMSEDVPAGGIVKDKPKTDKK